MTDKTEAAGFDLTQTFVHLSAPGRDARMQREA